MCETDANGLMVLSSIIRFNAHQDKRQASVRTWDESESKRLSGLFQDSDSSDTTGWAEWISFFSTASDKGTTMTPHRDITDEEWQRAKLLLPELRERTDMRGRPLADTRSVLNGVLWVIYSGATWSAMPRRYPSYQTCHRRFKTWHDEGVLKCVVAELFGKEGVALCDTIETRMRKQAIRAKKDARSQDAARDVQRKSPFVPAAPTATPAQPFNYRTVYRYQA